MKTIVVIAILIALAAWAALGLTFTNLLSGVLEERTCQTDCVRNYYFIAAGLGLVSAFLALVAFVKARFAAWAFFTLAFCGVPFAVAAGIFTIGTLGTMSH